MTPRNSLKQREIMSVILRAAGEGRMLDAREIADEVNYDVSFDAMRVSLRFLCRAGALVRLKGDGRRTLYSPTPAAYRQFRVLPGPSSI